MATLRIALAAVLIALCFAAPQDLNDQLDNNGLKDLSTARALFDAWKSQYQVTFQSPAEESAAFSVFILRAGQVKQHRTEHRSGKHPYNLALNKFSHLTFDDFRATRLGYSKYTGQTSGTIYTSGGRKKRALPTSLNYTAMGYVTSVKDQGQCGCCWTFSVTGALEGAYFKKTGKLFNFSQQQLVECTPSYVGCDGGVTSAAVTYIASAGGIANATVYPYVSQNSVYGPCKVGSVPMVPMAPAYMDIAQDDTSLMNALVTYGPISVAVAVGDPFMSYVSGIMDPTTACVPEINHAVLLVGYGTDATTKVNYWLIKNSWNTDWGEMGYFRLRRDIPDACGINEDSISMKV